MAEDSVLANRIDTGAWPLAVGDIVVLAVLLSAGAARHSGVSFLVDNPVYLAGTLAPFLVGWVVAAPLLGAYSPGAAESAKAAVPLGLRSWIVADLIGVGLRVTPLFHGGDSGPVALLIFAAVTTVVVGGGLAAWRWAFFAVR